MLRNVRCKDSKFKELQIKFKELQIRYIFPYTTANMLNSGRT